MSKPVVFYQEPQKESLIPILLSIAFVFCWTAIFSNIYSIFCAYSPLIYINFIACFAFGVSIAYGVKIALSIFPIYKSKTAIKLSIFVVILALYFS